MSRHRLSLTWSELVEALLAYAIRKTRLMGKIVEAKVDVRPSSETPGCVSADIELVEEDRAN